MCLKLVDLLRHLFLDSIYVLLQLLLVLDGLAIGHLFGLHHLLNSSLFLLQLLLIFLPNLEHTLLLVLLQSEDRIMHLQDLLDNPLLLIDLVFVELDPAFPLNFPIPNFELALDKHSAGNDIHFEVFLVLEQLVDNI